MSTCEVVAKTAPTGNMPQPRAARHGRVGVNEWIGVAIALVSSCLGGSAAAVTRYLVGNADPITLAILRWGIGFGCLLPVALTLKVRWPPRRDWAGVAAVSYTHLRAHETGRNLVCRL